MLAGLPIIDNVVTGSYIAAGAIGLPFARAQTRFASRWDRLPV